MSVAMLIDRVTNSSEGRSNTKHNSCSETNSDSVRHVSFFEGDIYELEESD
jgi:hypothetical protein